jgi:hypothetical protein
MGFLRVALIALIGLVMPAHAADSNDERPPVAKYGKVFRGPEGLTVSLLGIGKPEDEEYLLQYAGVNHDWDMKIFKVKRVPGGANGYNYRLKVNGEDYDTVVERKGYGGASSYQVYLPNGPKDVAVAYDESYSQRIQPQHYLTDYLNQKEGKTTGAVWR